MHSQKGSVLVLVILVCAALLFLATCLMDLNSSDVKIAANQRDGLQAYYLAATGLEIVFGILTEHDPFYRGGGNILFAGGNIDLNISALEQEGGGRRVQIVSTGKSGFITEQIIVEFQSFPACTGYVDAAELGWYDRESGEIIPGDHEVEGIISLGGPNLPSLTLNCENDCGAVFSAEQIFFRSNLTVESDLEIRADSIILQKNVHLCSQGRNLHFFNPSGDPLRVYLRGEVTTPDGPLLSPGVYLFPSGMQITKNSAMPDLQCRRVLPAVPGTIVYKKGIPN